MERESLGDKKPGLCTGCPGAVGLGRWRTLPWDLVWGLTSRRPEAVFASLGSPHASTETQPVLSVTWQWVCVSAQLLQSCPTICDPMDYTLPGSSVREILRSRILEWVAMLSSRGSS